MSLSAYDTLMVDHNGRNISGFWTSPVGITVRIRKNWVYVEDPKGWRKDGANYQKPVVMEVQWGDIIYKDVHILALSGPQKGIYFIAWAYKWSKNKKKIIGEVGCKGKVLS